MNEELQNDAIFEKTISDFESEFDAGNTPDLDKYFKKLPSDSVRLCRELLHTDLELKIRNGHLIRVEHYLENYPKIVNDEEFVDELIFTELKVRQQYEPGLLVAEYGNRFPSRVQRVLQKYFGHGFAESSKPPLDWASSPSYSDNEQRFRKLQLHRQGGLGNIWLAFDRELGRHVAIKEIKPKFSESKPHRSRFAREALVTGRLTHPGIIALYGRGKRADGSLYFAMQFIRGRTLRSAIAEFHEQSSSESTNGSDSLAFRRLIQHFIDVCNTVEYAHRNDVVHRDLKPDNIMIGEFGETFVVDWGLAQADFADLRKQNTLREEADFYDEAFGNAGCYSVDGSKIGSPGFMSPEQFAGNRDEIGPASDVFSLGATLLSLISNVGVPVSDQVIGDQKDAPQITVTPGFRQLESICHKAMHRNPRKRFSSAAALAEDVENFLLDRPVEAHNETSIEFLARLSRRYRAIVNTTLVAMGILVLVSLIAIAVISQAKQTAVLAEKKAVKLKAAESLQRQKAEKRTEQLTEATNAFVDLFSGTDEFGVGIDLNKITMQEVLDKLGEDIEKSKKDPIVKSFLLTVLAENERQSGNSEQAVELYETAMQELTDQNIEKTDLWYLEMMLRYGGLKVSVGDRKGAMSVINEVVALCRKNPDETIEQLFSALITKLKLVLGNAPIMISEARGILKEANSVASKINEHGIRLFELKMLENRMLFFDGKKAEYLQASDLLIEKWRANHPTDMAVVNAQVQIAEWDFHSFMNTKRTYERLENARQDAEHLLGPNHLKTRAIAERCALMMVFRPEFNEEEYQRGMEMLDSGRLIGIEKGWRYAAANSTRSMMAALLRTDKEFDYLRAIEIGEQLVEFAGQVEGSTLIGAMAEVHRSLSTAYEKTGDLPTALNEIEQAIEYGAIAHGKDSPRVAGMYSQRQNLKTGGKPARSAKAKELEQIALKLIMSEASTEKLEAGHAKLLSAWNSESVEERPEVVAMYVLTGKLARAYETDGKNEQAIARLEECLNYAEQCFGSDSPDFNKVQNRLSDLRSRTP